MIYRMRQFIETPRNLAALVFVVGAIGTVVATRVPNPYTLTLPALLVVGAVLAVAVGNRTAHLPRDVTFSPALYGSVYMLAVVATVGLYVANGYVRTFEVHLATVGLYVLAGISLVTLRSTRQQLGLVLATALLHRGTTYYASASQIGIDALLHNRWAAEIAASGTLQPLAASGTKYWYAPLYHVWNAGLVEALGLPVRDAAFVGVSAVVVLVPVLAIYDLLGRAWSPEMGVVGALLFAASDRPIALAVHTMTTSVGLVLFVLILYSAIRYLDTDEGGYQMLFVLFVTGLFLTHQLSLFITAVALTTYLLVDMIWEGRFDLRKVRLVAVVGFAGVVQSLLTRDPGGESSDSLITIVLRNVLSAFTRGDGRAASVLPQSPEFVVSGSDALSALHVLGLGILFCLAIVGTVSWLRRSSRAGVRLAMAFGGVVVVINLFAFALPLMGVAALLPYRWFSFLYVPLVMLAAPGVAALVAAVGRGSGSGPRSWHTARILLVVVLLIGPFSATMAWNYPGALDGPVFDDANGAIRLSTTDSEVAAMEHASRYGGGAVGADWFTALYLERHYQQSASTYQTEHGDRPAVWDEPRLFVDRPYTHSEHAGYMIRYDGSWYTVRGPLPPANPQSSTVYSNGEVQLLYGRQPLAAQTPG
jgi:hypothetical protein